MLLKNLITIRTISYLQAFEFGAKSNPAKKGKEGGAGTAASPKQQQSQKQQQTQQNQQKPAQKLNLDKTSEYLLEQFKKGKTRYAQSKDDYRVDVGLIIDRHPIFLNFSKDDMELQKFRYQMTEKYKMKMETPKELLEFNEKHPTEEFEKQNTDNLQTHSKKLENGEIIGYAANSKQFKQVDPKVTDPHSIQYAPCNRTYLMVKEKATGNWVFPSRPIIEKESFSDGKVTLFEQFSNKQWTIFYTTVYPSLCEKRDFTAIEKKHLMNKKSVGVKCFYFFATHLQGIIQVTPELYSDYSWVTKMDLSKYMNKERYNLFVNSLLI